MVESLWAITKAVLFSALTDIMHVFPAAVSKELALPYADPLA